MRSLPSHRQLVELLTDLDVIEQAGIDDLLRHEFTLIRERFPAADGDPQSYPDRYRRACALAGRVPRELCDDRNAVLAAALEAFGLYPRRAAMIDAIRAIGSRARATLANRNRQRSEVRV
ncbi:MAG: hypothetical protein JNM18_21630 [Planctomycetaceae bacterium]|nr:hypothetical protein [Planctomycetaceae bacterium]